MSKLQLFRRADGVDGAGYQIHHAGKPQISIAWADRPAERFTEDELARLKIRRMKTAETNSDGKPAETVTKKTVDELYDEKPAVSDQPVDDLPTTAGESQENVETTGVPEQTTGAPEDETTEAPATEPVSEAEAIRQYLAEHPNAGNKDVVAALAEQGIEVGSSQVSREKRKL